MSIVETARLAVASVIAVVGFVFMAIGAIGIWRFPDFYTRLHAVSVSIGPGATLTLLALAVAAPDWSAAGKLLLLAVLAAALAPMLSHFNGNAAYGAGLAPVAGPQASTRRTQRGARP